MIFFAPGHAAVIEESGSLLEFFAGTEQGCAYDNWISHTSEYDYFGYSPTGGYFAPPELDRETNGFGAYMVVDSLNDPDQVLSDWYQIFSSFIQGDVSTTDTRLSASSFADHYELVRLTDGGNVYLMLREVLNNDYIDDNGTPGDASDDVTGSFDYGWGLYVNKLSPAPTNPEVIINIVHPNADYIAPYVGIDAYLTIDAGLFIINGACRNIAWPAGEPYNSSNSLSDPSRNARTPFHECYKASVDLIGDEWAIQVHSYNAYPQHDGVPSVQLSAERENYTAHPNAPYMNWDHIDMISLTPDPAVPNGGNWQYPEVRIEDYYSASYPGGYRYQGYIPISNNVDLPGTSTNNQMVYTHIGHDFVNDRENWLHMEMDEFPDVVRLDGVSVEAFYGYIGPGSGVPTYANYAEVVHYYRSIFTAVADYMSYQLPQAAYIAETASLQEFYQGVEGNCTYDNWVSHISEGVADAGYNDEGPVELDRQLDGFGNFQLIPADVGGDSLLNAFYDIFTELFQGNVATVQNMLTDARLGGKYEVVTITDNGNDYYVLREVLNDYYFDDNGTPGDISDDITGSFDYGWGIYFVNPNAINPEIVLEVPHPCDDYTTPAIGFDAFTVTGAGLLFVNGAGREVEWTESAPYYNSKSLSDPTRNARTPFHEAHKAAVDMFGSEFVIQIHSYDTGSHVDAYDTELSTRNDYYPNQPVMDASTYFDVISLTPEYPIAANSIGGSDHVARRVDDYYSLYYGGGYSHQGNLAISNYVEQPGYVGNHQMLYTQANHDEQTDDEPWFHVEHDEFPNVINESMSTFYNFGSGVPTYANYANVVDYFRPLYTAIGVYFDGQNAPPVWTDVPASISVNEGDLIAFTVTGMDPDGDGLSITLDPDGIPEGYTFNDNGNGTGDFSWQTAEGDGGDYTATFTLSDGDLTDVAVVPIHVEGPPEPATAFASAEQAVAGTIQGDYTNTAQSDDSYEIITERQSGGKPANRHSYLEHIWTFDITGNTLTLHAEAYHSANGEGDDFILSGSFDGQNYTDLITVTKTADDDNVQTTAINGEANGTYYVKVVDIDRTRGNRNLDSFSLDYLAITYYQGDPPNRAPVWTDVPESITATWGTLIEFTVTGDDLDGDQLTITFDQDGIPDGYEFTDNGDGTALFSWQTVEADVGDYTATFTISDNELTDVAVVPIQVISQPEPGTMYVSAIDLTENVINKNQSSCTGVVTVIDLSDAAVEGALVSASWSGIYSGDVQGTTNGSGQVTFVTENMRRPNGYLTLTITDVTKAEWTYDVENENNVTEAVLGFGDYAAGRGDLTFNPDAPVPDAIMLNPSYPNPFNNHTTIRFGLPEDEKVRVAVYDPSGRRVATLLDRYAAAGWHSAVWTPQSLANGKYIVRLESGTSVKVRYLVLLR